jgi:hypothetical protein
MERYCELSSITFETTIKLLEKNLEQRRTRCVCCACGETFDGLIPEKKDEERLTRVLEKLSSLGYEAQIVDFCKSCARATIGDNFAALSLGENKRVIAMRDRDGSLHYWNLFVPFSPIDYDEVLRFLENREKYEENAEDLTDATAESVKGALGIDITGYNGFSSKPSAAELWFGI